MGMTVRISQRAHETLREIARAGHESMQAILDKAVEDYRRRLILEDANRGYEELRKDPKAWQEVEVERALWETTLADGLPEGEVWDDEGGVASQARRKTG